MSNANDWLKQAAREAKSRYTWRLNISQINFGINVCRLLKHKGWTEGELAARMGVTQPNVSRAINGGSSPTLETLAKYAHALDVEIADLIGEPRCSSEGVLLNADGGQVGVCSTSSRAANVTVGGEWR